MNRRTLLGGVLMLCTSAFASSPPGGGADCAVVGFASSGDDVPAIHPNRAIVRLREGFRLGGMGGDLAGLSVVRESGSGHVVDVAATGRLSGVVAGYGVVSFTPLIDMASAADPEAARRHRLHRYVLVEGANGIDLFAMASELAGVGAFDRIDADRRGELDELIDQPVVQSGPARSDWSTNDPFFEDQWSLENIGQDLCDVEGIPDADVNAPGAWARWIAGGGGQPRNVAIVDAGVSPTHEDLAGRVVGGINCAGGPPDDWDHGSNYHGTFCAGLIAAIPNNELGIAGLAWNANIYSVRVFNDFGIGFENEVIHGLEWCSQNDIDIVNMSLGFNGAGAAFADMIAYIDELGMLMVASTGNSAGQNVQYPAAFPEVMAVTATNNRDELWPNSTTGPEVDISAPGWGMVSLRETPTSPNGYAECSDGTSWAAPMVTAGAAMVWSRRPTLTAAGVRAILETTSRDLGEPGPDEQFGWGRLDVEAALASLEIGYPASGLTCIGDLTGDGQLDISDLLVFLQWFAGQEPGADLAPPEGVWDFADIIAYLERFMDGCGARVGGT